eukprot:TRINITY_DN29648_c0_g2_i1.p1 TRINITY_DN29648_c0_g2~~TRINITY_DN29648_c0_g2_i1.p1  ORF type:complete len:407 (+),score=56.61 TRINITY_DN29648_c0_g2_i1:84-1304(+)
MTTPLQKISLLLLSLNYYEVQAGSSVRRAVEAHRTASGEVVQPWHGRSVQDLHKEYSNIFRHGNRNAASHLWSTFLMDRAVFMSKKRFLRLSGGYCAVSGSPVSPSDATRYKLRLDRVDGSGKQAGFMYYCCWPCVCDTQDFIRVDTKTIRTADGSDQYTVAVIGNPCDHESALTTPFVQPFDQRRTTILQAAPEVQCDRGRLVGATMSDNGYVIISLFFDTAGQNNFQDETDFEFMCEDRKQHGYNSGMGEIFRRVAAIAPVKVRALAPPSSLTTKQLLQEIARRGIDRRGASERKELVSLLEGAQAEELRKLGVRELRLEAHRLGVDLKGVTEKSEIVGLLQRALTGNAVSSSKQPADMSVRELRAEATRLGLDTRGCLERGDFVNLLEEVACTEGGSCPAESF